MGGLAVFKRGLKATSGHGLPAKYEVGKSEEAD